MPSSVDSTKNWYKWTLLLTALILNFCYVFGGFACLSNPCIHGVCIDDLNTTYSCYCIDGYTGVQCQTNWDECWSSPCQNGGLCVDGIATFNCSCPAGFIGDVCEEDFNECESNPCLNNGTCIDGTNGYSCYCLPGYSGTHCDIDVAVCNATNETRCANGGVCLEGPGVSFTCKCPPGWAGYLCDSEIDECMSAPCQNGAVCIDLHAEYVCACLFGFTGPNCEEVVKVCPINPCKNNALCLVEDGHSVCYCVPDFHGDLCQFQYDECQLGPRCMNGGTCIDGVDNFTCSCPPNLTGVLCECLVSEDEYLDCNYISPTPMTLLSTMPISTFESTTFDVPKLTTQLMNFTTNFETDSTTFVTEVATTESIKTTETLKTTTDYLKTTFGDIKTTTEALKTSDIVKTTVEDLKTTTESMPTTIEPLKTTTELLTTTTEISTTPESSTIFVTSTPEITTTHITTTEATTTLLTTTSATTTTELPLTESTTLTILSTTIIPTIKTSEPSINASMTITTDHYEDYSTTPRTTQLSTFLTQEPTAVTTSETEESFTTMSTTFIEETTARIHPDCSKKGVHCFNGGTCIYTPEGHKCICPFDTDGLICETKLGIKNAAFNGDSFLTHRLYEKSRITIEFRAKTLSNEGVIFYANSEGSYMILYIENGNLKFRFSCGFQSMLLTELKNNVNNGYEMMIKAELEFTPDFKHCYASINLNNTLTMSGDQIALKDKFPKPDSWLHLGGIPTDRVKDNLPIKGFIGCMTDLKISGKSTQIFKDAEDGFEVSECSSLACLSNPCENGAKCSGKGEDWMCYCRNGFTGKSCGVSICENNPCQFGGTCLPFTGSGYICLCPYGKHGHFCENDMEVTETHFSSTIQGFSSFVAYPIPEGVSDKMELKFKFLPSSWDQIALLMFIGQKGFHDAYADHIAISFVKGYVMLTWNLGSGPRRIFTTKPLSRKPNSHMVHIGRSGRRAWLYVETLGNITGRSPGNLVHLDVEPLIFLGGHDSRNFSKLPHDLPLHTGFSGCIYDVEFKSGSVVLDLERSRHSIGRAIGQCSTTECQENVCQNRGACLYHGGTFTCLCQDGWFGPLCSSKYNPCDSNRHNCSNGATCVPLTSGYVCDCSVGRYGTFCENEKSLTDVSFSGMRSFLSLDPITVDPAKFNIDLELRPLSDKGLVMFVGRPDGCYLSLSMQSGLLEIRLLPGKQKNSLSQLLTIRSKKLLLMGVWYKIRIGKYGRKLYLFVDNVINTGVMNSADILRINGDEIYLGGLPDMSLLPHESLSMYAVPYTGCIRKFMVNNMRIPLNESTIRNGRNIADCDGTPCGGEYCFNNGTCWLDSSLNPHCTCIGPFYGDQCELLPSCNNEGTFCKNNGRCINDEYCSCTVGWTGAFCESSITVNRPKFSGRSYLNLNKLTYFDKKRETGNFLGNFKNLFLNFTTATNDGLLLFNAKEDRFLAIGLERGFLKIVLFYASDVEERDVEIPSPKFVSDGLKHFLSITINPLVVQLDDRVIFSKNSTWKHSSIREDNMDNFYLGGLPKNHKFLKIINMIFPRNFDGCIENFGTNYKNLIGDFNRFDGENIDICNAI